MVNIIAMLMQEDFIRISFDFNAEIEETEDTTVLENELSPTVIGLMHLHKMHVVNELYSNRAGKQIQKSIEMVCRVLFQNKNIR